MKQWISFDEWLRAHEQEGPYQPILDDYVPEWQRRLNHPELYPAPEDLE